MNNLPYDPRHYHFSRNSGLSRGQFREQRSSRIPAVAFAIVALVVGAVLIWTGL